MNDPRTQLLLAALVQALQANTEAVEEGTRQQSYSPVVGGALRMRLDEMMGTHVDKRGFSQRDDGTFDSGTGGNSGVRRPQQNFAGVRDLGRRLGDALAGQLRGLGLMLLTKFGVVLAPLAVFGAILSANNSGFQLFASTMKIFAATVAPILLPIFVGLAAAVLNVSDQLWAEIVPALEQFYSAVVTNLLPAVEKAARVFGFFAKNNTVSDTLDAMEFAGKVTESAEEGFDRIVGGLGLGGGGSGFLSKALAAVGGVVPGGTGAGGVPGASGVLGGVLGGAGSGAAAPTVRQSFGEVLRELRMSIGPKAQFSSLAQLSRNAQLAAINQSPFEAKLLDRVTKAVETLERVEANTRSRGGLGY